MSAKHIQSFWVGMFIALNLLASVALAEPDVAATPKPATQAAPVDPVKLMEQAEKALDRQDLTEAMKFYFQAAEQNYTPAQVAVGKFADSAQYYDAAVGWFLMAAMQGDAEGQYNLARMYESGNGIQKDEAKASYWYRRSAAKNFIPALKVLAGSYRLGSLGVKIDLEQAKAWEAKALRLEAIERKTLDEKMAKLAEEQKKLREEEAKKANK